jgi:molecular chaperone GrpE
MTHPHSPAEETPVEAETAPEVAAEAAVDANAARIAELEKQLAEMKDRALREMAEAENTRRRAQKEREETSKYAVASFAKEMLAVADNFSRALTAAPQEGIDPAVANLITGLQATERQLAASLDRVGVRKIESLGELFDPNLHQVMIEVDAPEKPAGTIVQELQAGYVIHDRLLREALVAVAKGGPAPKRVDTSA